MKFLQDTDHISIPRKQSGPKYAAIMVLIAQVPRAGLAIGIASFFTREIKPGNER